MNNVFRLIWSRRLGTLVPVPEGLGTAGRKNRRMMRRLRRLMRKMVGPGAAALTLGMLVPLGAQALPTGGQVVAGQAAITQNGSQMTITQSSDKAILNWQGFDIGAQERVTFAQPSTSSVALNRVVGNTASAIYGGMDANGQVFLVNQNGVYFAPGAQVSAGGLLVSTLGISDSDFMAGRLNFSGDSTAGVTNDGTIRAGQGGYVAFIGRHVDNEGQIITPGGKTALGAGGAVDISLSGNALLQFRVSADALDAQVKNGGVIQAENGAVVMSAHARDALMKTVVNNTGVIEARGVRRSAGGTIELLGGDTGTVAVSGRLDASSSAGNGGKIAVRGQHVVAKSTARLDVTGAQGGGEIAFGGGLHGAGGVQAETTTVEQGALLDASATGLGHGGTIAIWSDIMRADGVTLSYGTLLAKGGAQGGNGGMIETSGHRLDVTGSTVSTKAPAGADGTWLIDPYNLTVTDSSANSANAGTNTPAGADSTILASSISTALASGNVTIQTTGTSGTQAGDITVDAVIGWSSDNKLTFDAAGNIAVNAAITASGTAPGLALKYGQSSTKGPGASYSINAPVTLSSGASFTTQLGSTGATVSYTILTDATALQNINTTGLSGDYVLGSDIDLSSIANFTPIGNGTNLFTGQFDGLGHTISALTINRASSNYVGLFGNASNAMLANVGLVDANVTGQDLVGGLVGCSSNSTISNAYATGTISGSSNVGGLVGNNITGTIRNAYAAAAVSGQTAVGGLVGQNSNNGTISNAYATGAATGLLGAGAGTGSNVGGLVGVNYLATINNAYATGAVSGTASDVGGLVGFNYYSTISNVYATGAVSGTSSVGGLMGATSDGTITNGYWDTTTSGTTTGEGYGDGAGVSGLSTAELAGGLPSGFDGAIWSTSDNQSTPWLLANRSFGTVSGSVILGRDSSATPQRYDVIANATQLQNITSTALDAAYVLAQSLDLSGISDFNPIGSDTTPFTGKFDGLGHTISNLTINRPSTNYVGLFSYTSGATISNVGLVGGSVSGHVNVGGLVGYNSGSTISNVYATGVVSGTGDDVGGLVGYNSRSTISNAYATGAVSGTTNVGGLVGDNSISTISNAYATGAVSGSRAVGGLVGMNASNSTISNAYATGVVSGPRSVGGLAGYNSRSTISDAYWDTTTSGLSTGLSSGSETGVTGLTTAELAGGLPSGFDGSVWSTSDNQSTPWLLANRSFGTVSGSVILGSDSSATPQQYDVIATTDQLQNINTAGLSGTYVLGNDLDLASIANFAPIGDNAHPFVGTFDGLGHTLSNLTIDRPSSSYVGLFGVATGAKLRNVGLVDVNVKGRYLVGGLVGAMYFGSTLSNAYATGVVSGANSVGGLVGTLTYGGSIRNAYATATVTGTGDFTGGLLGYSSNGTISNAYATGAVSGISKVGGLVGLSGYSGTISNAYATGAVSGTSNVGGLVGVNTYATIKNAYATGAVSGTSQVGGLAGSNSNSTISDAYWDLTTSGQTNAVGLGDGSGASGLSTAELAASLPSGFDGAVWSTSDNQSTPWLLANSSFGRVSGSVILGSDSSATPVRYDVIASATQLQNINTTGLSGDYVLGNDLDLASIANFAPIGGGSNQFTGQFDGLGHTISNLTIDRPTTRGVGLFGYTQNATVSNLGVVGGSVTGDNTIGALVGFSLNSTISNAYATAAVSGSNVVGGLVGSSNHSTISNAYAAGVVTGTGSNTGGLVAYSSNSTISNAYATGAVSVAYGFAGGLVGWINNGTINNAYATGAVSGTNYVGGLVGNSANSTINSAYATGAVLGTKANTGGLVGSNSHGTISHAYWDLTTSGLTDGVGSGDGSGVSGLSTAQMHQKASFAGFDFSDTPDWVIYEGHTAPLLAAFLTPLSVSASASHVTYDGSVAGASSVTTTVTGTAPAGALFGNSGTLNNAATPFGDARNVGTYDADLWSDQQGYRITQTAAKLSIDPRSLTGSIAAGRSTYGDALAPGAVSFTNVVSGDDVSGTVSVDTTGHLSTSGHLNAGSYIGGETVSALSGADAGNYTIGSITGDYTVTQRALTVAFTGKPTRAYDGTLVAHLVQGDFSVSGLVLGEQMQVTQTRGEYASAEVGTHIAVSADLTSGDFRGIGGTDLANYSLPVPVTTNGFGEIRQRVSTGGPGSPLQNTHVNRLSGLPVAGVLNVPNGVIPPAMPSLEIQNGGVEGADDNAS